MIQVFVDFDGTITKPDVGDALFEQFGGQKSLDAVQEYRKRLISAVECFRRECAACGEVEKGALDAFLASQPIDETFVRFTEFCQQRELSITILSDGMDYYITFILEHHGIGRVKFFANHLELIPIDYSSRVRFTPSFSFTDESCERCACCKRNHILTHCADDDIIVYIGEGYSDRCPVRYADIVFAKEELVDYCRQENISYFEYRTFADVENRLCNMLDISGKRSPFRKRRQAELARRDVFIAE